MAGLLFSDPVESTRYPKCLFLPRAKLELREEATESDAEDVIQIMRFAMADTMSAEDGVTLNSSRVAVSSRGAAKKFIMALERFAVVEQRNKFSVEEMKHVLAGCGAKVANFFDFLSNLNTQGYLLKKSSKEYQLLSMDF